MVLDCGRHIKSYMAVHIEQWHEFATTHLGIDVKQEDIIFVSGCTKSSVWAEATFNGAAGQITHRLCHEEARDGRHGQLGCVDITPIMTFRDKPTTLQAHRDLYPCIQSYTCIRGHRTSLGGLRSQS